MKKQTFTREEVRELLKEAIAQSDHQPEERRFGAREELAGFIREMREP